MSEHEHLLQEHFMYSTRQILFIAVPTSKRFHSYDMLARVIAQWTHSQSILVRPVDSKRSIFVLAKVQKSDDPSVLGFKLQKRGVISTTTVLCCFLLTNHQPLSPTERNGYWSRRIRAAGAAPPQFDFCHLVRLVKFRQSIYICPEKSKKYTLDFNVNL